MNYADRIANYLHQSGGHRVHYIGSEGGLTSQQRRRARKKMDHRRAAAIRRAYERTPRVRSDMQ